MALSPTTIWNPAGRLDPLYNAEDANQLPVNLYGNTPALVYTNGQVLGEIAATPGLFAPYTPGASDGTQNAKRILAYDAQSLASPAGLGAITWVGEWGVASANVPAFTSGMFDLSRIIGLDADALTALAGSIVAGALGADEVDSITISATGGTWALTIPSVTRGGVVYPAVTVSAIAWNVSAATLATAINAALAAAAVPASATVTGGVGGTNPLVITFHGALSGVAFVLTTAAGGLTGGSGTAAITRSTHGAAASGVLRIG